MFKRKYLRQFLFSYLTNNGQQSGHALLSQSKAQGLSPFKNDAQFYIFLHRLQAQGLLECEWRRVSGRARKYYRLSTKGKFVLAPASFKMGPLYLFKTLAYD